MHQHGWQQIGRDVLALLLAASCPGCDRGGTLLCETCLGLLRADPHDVLTPRGLRVHAALRYEGVPASVIRSLKQDGATLLARPLGAALSSVLRAYVPEAPLVCVPTSRAAFRRRGYRIPDLLVRRAGFLPQRLLTTTRAVEDQRGLGRDARERNVAGGLRVIGRVTDRTAVIVDDVVTTGATIDEAARALRAAGVEPICAVALAATPRRRDTEISARADSDRSGCGD